MPNTSIFSNIDRRGAQYLRLMERIFECTTGEELLAMVPDILAWTGGHLTFDFGETWTGRWHHLMGDDTPIPENAWPAEAEPDYEAEEGLDSPSTSAADYGGTPDSREGAMRLIRTRSELDENVATLAGYLRDPGVYQEFARRLIGKGICFIVVAIQGEAFFAPSRFVGYCANTRHDHLHNDDKDGRETNGAITRLLGTEPTVDDELEKLYEAFCVSRGIALQAAPFGIQRKFWDIR
jgi:hypothetical protein